MKFLLDTCISGRTAEELKEAGHDTEWTGAWETDPGDEKILAYAHEQGRILVTLDKDFGELAIVYRKPHSGILRLVDFSVQKQTAACLQVIEHHTDDLLAGAIITARPGKIRVRQPNTENS